MQLRRGGGGMGGAGGMIRLVLDGVKAGATGSDRREEERCDWQQLMPAFRATYI